jgi:RNase H-fold protein (predicted Holliday junction resolvase)
MNDQMIFFHIGDMLTRYNVRKIMIGRPAKQQDVQQKIIAFMQNLDYIIDKNEVTIEKVEEDYTSVQSGEIVSNFKKNAASDTVSAMLILERGLKNS